MLSKIVSRYSIFLILCICFSSTVVASTLEQDFPLPTGLDNAEVSAAAHSGSAPIDPPLPTDETFTVDVGPGLDTGCSYRSAGPLVIKIAVDRYVGEIDPATGFLKDPNALIANKVISPKARLIMPAYDVDSSAVPPSPEDPEVDDVYFNNVKLSKPLTGVDVQWIKNEFEIPIDKIKFPPSRGAYGVRPTPVENEIRIEIDTANVDIGLERWCTAIDWAALQFKAMAPILLIHGTDSGPQAWENGITDFLTTNHIPFEHDIQLLGNGSINTNGGILSAIVENQAASFGVKNLHLVAHSKGGLDSRRFLSTYYFRKIKILSLHTISTPHHGTILADIAIASRTYNDPGSKDPDINEFLKTDWWINLSGKGPRDEALIDQQTANVADFNKNNEFPADVRLYTYGADADLNNDGNISFEEQTPLFDQLAAVRNPAFVGTIAYHVLRDVSSITVIQRNTLFGLNEWHEIIPTSTSGPQANDLVVTDTSSQHPSQVYHSGPVDRNHSTVLDEQSIIRVIGNIRSDFPLE